MTLDFASWFASTHGHAPYAWQASLAERPAPGHRLIRVPTGFGKTLGVLSAWLYHGVTRQDPRWPRRLLWVLPMRTLVEQTAREAEAALRRLGILWEPGQDHAGRVGVHVLMGDADAGEWHLHPSERAVLIGTQDMVLSRALNRGYGAARARWPIDLGLLSQDTLWVLDEIQLMGVGFATALQLTAWRAQDAGRLPAPLVAPTWTWAMSATLQRGWLARSPDTQTLQDGFSDIGLHDQDHGSPLWSQTRKPARLLPAEAPSALAERILADHGRLPSATPLTLVVMNTVDRAVALHAELTRRAGALPVHLVHSRFRGQERRGWAQLLRKEAATSPRILVATQVIEAGVDLSADLLFTELCPWPSLVQRVGRLARRGGEGTCNVMELDLLKQAAPYDTDELSAARDALAQTGDLSPRALEALESRLREESPAQLSGLYPYDPPHLLGRDEIDELFDTTPDLSGGDLDISRYIRTGDERDLRVAWVDQARDDRGRPTPPPPALRPTRDALCAIPFLSARDWLCGKKSGGVEPRRLRAGVAAWVWDYPEGAWRLAQRADLRPGTTVLVDAALGGYDPARGFDPTRQEPVPVVGLVEADPQERADSAEDQEDLSQLPGAAWQTIGYHGARVADELRRMLPDEGHLRPLLELAARWHDLGKAHPAFQGAILGDRRPDRADLAKAPPTAWRPGRDLYQWSHDGTVERRPGLRHELASALALFDVLRRHAPAEHPSRLGDLAACVQGSPPRGGEPGALEQEILDLSAEDLDLVLFLVLSHHGKLRARLHAGAADQEATPRGGTMPIRGIYEGDRLPAVALADASGQTRPLPESLLTLEPAELGLSPQTGRSWTERVDGLRARWGPFALAWMEALLRAADVRASRDASLRDPALLETP